MRVLVAESDFDLVESIAERLRSESFVVESCSNGETVMQKTKETRYDVLILDLLLPGRSGFEVVSALRSLGDKTPILMTSARRSVEDRVLGLNLGADDFLEKNFSLAEMVARIKSLIRRKSSEATNMLRHQDLVVNLSNMQVMRSGASIYLTRKEVGILVELLRYKGKIISRESLMNSVWGEEIELEYSSTLDTHIRTLRKKVDRPYKNKLIQTVRGYGYLMS